MLVKMKEICGTPLEAVTHGPVARLVVICSVKFIPADAGHRTMICPPVVPMASGGTLVVTMLSESGWLTMAPRLSAAATVKLKRPLLATVPEMSPFVARFKFPGKLPDDNDQL